MARDRGLIRWVRLMLDKDAANKTARQTQKSLDKGTDPKKAERNLSRVDKAGKRLRATFLRVGAAIGAALGARALLNFGRDSVRIAAEADAIWTRLAGTLETNGIAFADVRDEITSTARAMQDATTIGDEDFAGALQQLIAISGDYETSMENMTIVADLAAGAQIDLKSAAMLVGRAMVGQTTLLTRYGIIVGENETAMEAMRRQFGGLAENEANSVQGKLKQLNNEWSDFRQAIGDAMIETGDGASVLERLAEGLKVATQWVNENRREIGYWGQFTFSTIAAVGGSIGNLLTFVKNGVEVVIDAATAVFGGATYFILETANTAIRALNGLISLADRIPGVDIDFRIGEFDAVSYLNLAKAAMGEFVQDSIEGGNALLDVARDWKTWGESVYEASENVRKARENAKGEGGGGGGGVGPALPMPKIGMADTGEFQTGLPVTLDFSPEVRARVAENTTWLEQNWESIGSAAQNAAYGVTGAWQDAFGLLFEEGANLGDFMAELGAGMAGALLGGLAEFASGKVRENVALALEMAARALGFISLGAGQSAAAAWASAAQHTAAATAWSALAGASGAAQGAVAGGGRGGMSGGVPSGARDIGGRLADRLDTSPEVHIYIDPLDPQNPAYQRNVAGAYQYARERYGENVRIHGSGG